MIVLDKQLLSRLLLIIHVVRTAK